MDIPFQVPEDFTPLVGVDLGAIKPGDTVILRTPPRSGYEAALSALPDAQRHVSKGAYRTKLRGHRASFECHDLVEELVRLGLPPEVTQPSQEEIDAARSTVRTWREQLDQSP